MDYVGGEIDQSYQYIKNNSGIDTEETYPYKNDENPCRLKPEGVGATVVGFINIKSKNEAALQEAMTTPGPIAVTRDASHRSFPLYRQGSLSVCFCLVIND